MAGRRARLARGQRRRGNSERLFLPLCYANVEIVALVLPWGVVAFLAWLLVGVVRRDGQALPSERSVV